MSRLMQKFFALLIVGAMIATLSACGNSYPTKESYRSIKVYQTKGQAVIEREKVGKMDAIENLKLLSGDLGEVFVASNMRLQLDEDKFILIEEQSRLCIEAEGDDDTSKTRIKLLEGAVTCEIENKLSKDSFFEISTPNSIMAVRGTTFRVAYYVDPMSKDGKTTVQTFGGTVTVTPTDKKGTPTEISRDITGGQQATVVDVKQINESTNPDAMNIVGRFETGEMESLNLVHTSLDTISFLLNEDHHRTYGDLSVGEEPQTKGESVSTSEESGSESSDVTSGNNGAISEKPEVETVGDTVFSVEELINAREEIPENISEKPADCKPEKGELVPKPTQSNENMHDQNQAISSKQPPSKPTEHSKQSTTPNQPPKPTLPDIAPDVPNSVESDQSTNNNNAENDNENVPTGDDAENGDDGHDTHHQDDHSDDTSDHSGDSDDNKDEDDHSGDDDQGTGEKPKPVVYTLTCRNGSAKLSVIQMLENALISEPSQPDESKAGYWSLTPSGSPVSFVDFQIHSDITLYWVEESPDQYTVVFQHDDSTFCSQTVLDGALADTPHLQPTQNGYWQKEGDHSAFDFTTTKIHTDTTLHWISETNHS